jgi:hypothetical protein
LVRTSALARAWEDADVENPAPPGSSEPTTWDLVDIPIHAVPAGQPTPTAGLPVTTVAVARRRRRGALWVVVAVVVVAAGLAGWSVVAPRLRPAAGSSPTAAVNAYLTALQHKDLPGMRDAVCAAMKSQLTVPEADPTKPLADLDPGTGAWLATVRSTTGDAALVMVTFTSGHPSAFIRVERDDGRWALCP